MKRDDFLVEIHTEELPPKSLRKLGEAFCEKIAEALQKAGLHFKDKQFFATPRRLAVLISDLDAAQPDQEIERKGPAVVAAFDKAGNPTPACVGFAKSCGVPVSQLITIKSGQGEWVGYKQQTKGKAITDLLPTIVTQALLALPIAKRMRWGASESEFVRPVHSVMMLYGKNVVKAEILGHEAGRVTQGHRFHSSKPISIKSAKDYESQLEKQGHVIADFEKRKKMIEEGSEALVAKKFGKEYEFLCSEDLLDEVTGLVEWPAVLSGSFDEQFLQVPSVVLISAMSDHQRYFQVRHRETHQLLPNFIFISNIDSKKAERVIHGNERVLRARLSDAAFFFETDKQERLDSRIERLKHVLYREKLGTLYDKSQRISQLAGYIMGKINSDVANVSLAKRAGLLAKADLTTNMVGEFPELQGMMGFYYASNDGEPREVALAIHNHYMPSFAGQGLPPKDEYVTIAVAIADRIDSLVGAFCIGQVPTGDKDPFGLRRAAIGLLRYLIENEIHLDLTELINQAIQCYADQQTLSDTNQADAIIAFINERLRMWYQEQGFAPDLFAAVAAVEKGDLFDIDRRIKAVQAFKKLNEAESLSAANKRVSNILKTADVLDGTIDEKLFEHEAEKVLAKKLREKHQSLQSIKDYKDSLMVLADLRQPVDDFFDNVMVMTDDKARRDNRIRLLKELRQLFLRVADIALLQQHSKVVE